METQVHVTLTALNGDIYPAERVLNLRPGRRTMNIGRASRSINKGIVGAADNGWFDSPVMSRTHAEIELNREDNAVMIKDIGSMHGTFLNNAELKQHERTPVNDNDIVVFGTKVTRGTETIPACAFRITYAYSPYNSENETLTFACPDSSDIDEDYDASDNDRVEEPSSDDGVSVGSPPVKPSQSINAIDLTEDDTPSTSAQKKLDILASQSSAAMGSKDEIAGRTTAVDDDSAPVPSAIILDSDDEDEHISSIECDSVETDSDDNGSADEIPFVGPAADNRPLSRPEERFQQFEKLLSSSFGGQPHDQKHIQVSESIISDHDNESDLNLADAEREGLRAFYDLPKVGSASPDYDPDHEEGYARKRLRAIYDLPKVGSASPDYDPYHEEGYPLDKTPITHRLNSVTAEEACDTPSSFGYASQSPNDKPSSSFRQPSPSDAAMVKTTPQTSKPVPVHHFPSNYWKLVATRSLQEKANKRGSHEVEEGFPSYDYPIAATIAAASAMYPDLTESQKRKSSAPDEIPLPVPEIQVVAAESATSLATDLGKGSRSTSPPLPYMDAQSPELEEDRCPSPFLETSALVDDRTCAMKNASPQSGRSKLRIDDIIDSPTTPEPETRKRKAEDISNVIESEVRAWASACAQGPAENSPSAVASGSPQAAQSTPTSNSEESESVAAPSQASKRLKKMAEGAAYIALGGVGLFSILVATAPDFL